MNIWSTASLIKELVYAKWNKACEIVFMLRSKAVSKVNKCKYSEHATVLPSDFTSSCFAIMRYLIYYHKNDCGDKISPGSKFQPERWWICKVILQRAVKTNMPVLTPLGYSPGFISGMLISQRDLLLLLFCFDGVQKSCCANAASAETRSAHTRRARPVLEWMSDLIY